MDKEFGPEAPQGHEWGILLPSERGSDGQGERGRARPAPGRPGGDPTRPVAVFVPEAGLHALPEVRGGEPAGGGADGEGQEAASAGLPGVPDEVFGASRVTIGVLEAAGGEGGKDPEVRDLGPECGGDGRHLRGGPPDGPAVRRAGRGTGQTLPRPEGAGAGDPAGSDGRGARGRGGKGRRGRPFVSSRP